MLILKVAVNMWCFGNHRGKNLKKFKKGHCLKVKNKQTSMLN